MLRSVTHVSAVHIIESMLSWHYDSLGGHLSYRSLLLLSPRQKTKRWGKGGGVRHVDERAVCFYSPFWTAWTHTVATCSKIAALVEGAAQRNFKTGWEKNEKPLWLIALTFLKALTGFSLKGEQIIEGPCAYFLIFQLLMCAFPSVGSLNLAFLFHDQSSNWFIFESSEQKLFYLYSVCLIPLKWRYGGIYKFYGLGEITSQHAQWHFWRCFAVHSPDL